MITANQKRERERENGKSLSEEESKRKRIIIILNNFRFSLIVPVNNEVKPFSV